MIYENDFKSMFSMLEEEASAVALKYYERLQPQLDQLYEVYLFIIQQN